MSSLHQTFKGIRAGLLFSPRSSAYWRHKNAQRFGNLCWSMMLMRRARLSESRPSDSSSNEPVSPSAIS